MFNSYLFTPLMRVFKKVERSASLIRAFFTGGSLQKTAHYTAHNVMRDASGIIEQLILQSAFFQTLQNNFFISIFRMQYPLFPFYQL